jgi:DNA-binding response OmpR family regulator
MMLKALEAGCCSYVVKPFNAEALEKAVRTAIE